MEERLISNFFILTAESSVRFGFEFFHLVVVPPEDLVSRIDLDPIEEANFYTTLSAGPCF